MNPTELAGVMLVLVGTAVVGVVVHELAHALALELFAVPYSVEWLPGWTDAGFRGLASVGALASVTPHSVPAGKSPTCLRIAAMMPLGLASPLLLVPFGVLPDPFLTGTPLLQAAAIGWVACALPSPQDFSLLFHAEAALADRRLPESVQQ